MKRKLLLFYTLFVLSLCVSAQDSTDFVMPPTLKFGYLSYEKVLKSMPDYAVVQQRMSELRAQYDAELKRVEQDFNLKYEEFLEGQRDFPETILRKRQSELKELLERNVAFKAESLEQLKKAEADLMAPLKERLDTTLTTIGTEQGYAFILNTDAGAVSFINPAQGEDINEVCLTALQAQ